MTPARQFDEMLARFDPAIVKLARGAISRLRKLMPGATRLAYDNAYALVIGFSASERASEAVLSVAIFPKKVAVCFIWGAELPDPDGLLRGGGKQVRNIRLAAATDLDRAPVKKLLRAAVAASATPFPNRGGALQIRAVSAKQRSRR